MFFWLLCNPVFIFLSGVPNADSNISFCTDVAEDYIVDETPCLMIVASQSQTVSPGLSMNRLT
ncbi:hypothetical protein A9B99_11735 [Mangrovibacter phragmitis]|uniref:Secreted protein n=1 Tax=Mangrovibacter phragmitis TaxID=1691903 RepID=A0A1B7L142_9ENTR|nr:hypothetical protein A9B99_11735 [Mangrovibacter phragmitis]